MDARAWVIKSLILKFDKRKNLVWKVQQKEQN